METLRPRVAQAELVKLKMKALPESSDQVEQAEPDEDFERMANMDEDDQNYQGDIDERKQIPEPPDIPSDVMRNNAIRQLAEYERREHSD